MRASFRSFAPVMVNVVIGCANAAALQQAGSSRALRDTDDNLRGRSPSDVIFRDEIAKIGTEDLTMAILRLRPRFLRNASWSLGVPRETAVYLNGVYAGDEASLTTIPITAVERVVYLRSSEAFLRYGLTCRCRDGAVLITTTRR